MKGFRRGMAEVEVDDAAAGAAMDLDGACERAWDESISVLVVAADVMVGPAGAKRPPIGGAAVLGPAVAVFLDAS